MLERKLEAGRRDRNSLLHVDLPEFGETEDDAVHRIITITNYFHLV